MAARRKAPYDPVTDYARQVVEGAIVAGKWVRLACERHLNDLKTARTRGLKWDLDAALHAIEFFRFCKHSKGEWAGTPVKLELWQQFIVGSIFGWKWKKTGLRRYRIAFEEVARKNGKSTKLAGVGLYLMIADDEPGAEVYTAATKRDQARIVWDEAKRMVMASKPLRNLIRPLRSNLSSEWNNSKFEPLASEARSLDGLNPHGVIVDEPHALEDHELWGVLMTAVGARRQPLMYAITTAGFSKTSVGFRLHEYALKVLSGIVQDDAFFAYVATIDEGDDPFDEAVWIKANPNLGVSVKLDTLRQAAERAKAMPAELNEFLCKHLNVWVNQETRWMPMDAWDACGVNIIVPDHLRGRAAYGGLDLSATTDITALVLVVPSDDGFFDVMPDFWIPDANLDERIRRDGVPYDVWIREGFMRTTSGPVVDYRAIRHRIEELGSQFDLREIAYDRWHSAQLITELMDEGLTMVPIGQGYGSMSAPMKELLKLVLEGKVRHGGHPVLRWMADNVVAEMDAAGNIKPSKAKSKTRIDGIVALIMALDRALRHGSGRVDLTEFTTEEFLKKLWG